MKVLWTKTASNDFKSAFDYIKQGNLYKHKETMDSIEDTIDAVCKNPSIGKAIRTKTAREIKVPLSPFIIAYRSNNDRLEILGLFHKSRIWK